MVGNMGLSELLSHFVGTMSSVESCQISSLLKRHSLSQLWKHLGSHILLCLWILEQSSWLVFSILFTLHGIQNVTGAENCLCKFGVVAHNLWANSKHRDASRINVAVHDTLLPWCISVILSEFGAFSGGGGETIIERVRVKYYTLLI